MNIYEYIQRELKGFALSLTKNIHDAEDLIQDTCERMFVKYQGEGLVVQRKLCCTVMKNIFIDNTRRHKETTEIFDSAKVIDNDVWGIMQRKELQMALLNLSKNQSFACRLRLSGYSTKDIATETGENFNNINQYFFRGKQNLIKQLNAA